MDIVLPYKSNGNDEELRYALRSIAKNVPHRKVWLVGQKPSWVTNVEFVMTYQLKSKYRNVGDNINNVCRRSDLTDEFILWNNDFYCMKPIKEVLPMHRGLMSEVYGFYNRKYPNGSYTSSMRTTFEMMVKLGIYEPLSYELHVPMVFNKHKKLDLSSLKHDLVPKRLIQMRTAYGNLHKLGGVKMRDVKVYPDTKYFESDWYSSDDSTWVYGNWLRELVMKKFDTPCIYEKH
jgi:hypothetical protein